VNVAARLESLAAPGGICISGTVREHLGNKLALSYEDLGAQSVKNIAEPVRVFRVLAGRDGGSGEDTTDSAQILPARRALVDGPCDRDRDDRASPACVAQASANPRVDSAAGEAGVANAEHSDRSSFASYAEQIQDVPSVVPEVRIPPFRASA
jgi:hypothetical protein